MKKSRLKKIAIVFTVIICLGVLELVGTIPYVIARISSSVYITANYPGEDFKFDRAEYLYGFGDYGVVYTDEAGGTQGLGLQMYPKEFPVFVRYDSIKQHA